MEEQPAKKQKVEKQMVEKEMVEEQELTLEGQVEEKVVEKQMVEEQMLEEQEVTLEDQVEKQMVEEQKVRDQELTVEDQVEEKMVEKQMAEMQIVKDQVVEKRELTLTEHGGKQMEVQGSMGKQECEITMGQREKKRKGPTEWAEKAEEKSREHINWLIANGNEEGLEIKESVGKGLGVFATQDFTKGKFVVEYYGELLEKSEAKQREARYEREGSGCYMYYFRHQDKSYCVDATVDRGRLGRMVNHSKKGNCRTKVHLLNGVPHLILIASRKIQKGEEILYDYGDRRKHAVISHPWLQH